MKGKQLVLNTLVFSDVISKGKLQHEFIKTVKDLKLNTIEIRRELIKNMDFECSKIKSLSTEYGIDVYYSVPDILFKKGELNREIFKYINEAKAMGALRVKFNIGEFDGFNEKSAADLKNIADDKDILITVENDQTNLSGRIEPIMNFLELCKKNNIHIYYTLDVGNYCWVKEDPLENAIKLKNYTKYIHLKDVRYDNGKPCTAYLNQGSIDWEKILSNFTDDIPVGLEYPCGEEPEKVLRKEIEKIL